jgi:hypothetical protein
MVAIDINNVLKLDLLIIKSYIVIKLSKYPKSKEENLWLLKNLMSWIKS